MFLEEDRAVGSVVFYLHPGLADWEASFVLPEVTRAEYPVQTVAESKDPVVTMGGLSILPDETLDRLRLESLDLLLLPGGESWNLSGNHHEILELAVEHYRGGGLLAAICGATYGLARRGLLDELPHTSNSPELLSQFAPSYQGRAHYQNQRAVRSDRLITAAGTGALEFGAEVLMALGLFEEKMSRDWIEFHRLGTGPNSHE